MTKWTTYGLILALGWCGATVAEGAIAAPPSCEDPVNVNVLDAQRAFGEGQVDKAVAIMKAVIERPTFAHLPEATQAHAKALYGVLLASGYHQYAAALVQLKAATQSACATKHVWKTRFRVAFDGDDRAEAMKTITTMADHWPDWLDGLDYWIVQLEADTQDAPLLKKPRDEMMAALARIDWKADPDMVASTPPDSPY